MPRRPKTAPASDSALRVATTNVPVPSDVPGRPTRDAIEKGATLLEAIREGNYPQTACHLAGVDFETFKEWCLRGEQESAGKYRRFLDAVRLAEAESERRAVQTIRAAGNRDWKAESTWLGRRHRERWAEQTKLQPSSPLQISIGIAVPGQGLRTPAIVPVVTEVPELDQLPEPIEAPER